MSPEPWQPPADIGEYRLVRLLGRGAMGEVYLAHDTVLDRPVALKFIGGVEPGAWQRERFFREARAIARIQHPNVLSIHRVAEVQRRPYFVSEFLPGQSLDQLAKPLAWRDVLDLAVGLARGLCAAHRGGVLHRDLKPSNVIRTDDGQVKLIDFGVAKLRGAATAPEDAFARAPAPQRSARPAPATGDATVDAEPVEPEPPSSRPEPAPPVALPAAVDGTGLIGTPLYMAPELWRGEPATAASDLYSLGVVLYELASGDVPHRRDTWDQMREAVQQPAAPLNQVAPRVHPDFAALVERCLAVDPSRRFHSADELRERLEALRGSTDEETAPLERPYPGLLPFTDRESGTFFGRAGEIRGLLDRLRGEPLVVVAGDSGVGKSSLCRAGVLPRVRGGALGLGGAWAVCALLPGRRPLSALAAALAPRVGRAEREVLEELRDAPAELGRRLHARGEGLLIFVDQLEELLTLAEVDEAASFARALGTLAEGAPAVRVLATARGDFLSRLAELPAIGEHLSRGGLYFLPHLTGAGLREAITAPARRQGGFTFESEALVDTLAAAGQSAGGLPLLQFVLAELWERRDRERRVIPAAALEAAGGVQGALARHADGVVASLLPGPRAAARQLLLRLVLAEGARARRTRAELLGPAEREDVAARAALEALVRGRLVLAREAGGGEAVETYELAHEALLEGWDTLRGWLASGVEQRALAQRLERACAEWQRLGRPAELLWSGPQLAEVERLGLGEPSVAERAFLRASRRGVWRRRVLTAAGAGSLALLLVLGGGELRARWLLESAVAQAIQTARQDQEKALAAERQEEALRREAFAAFDRILPDKRENEAQRESAERLWAEALAKAAEVERLEEEATRELEAVLLRDPKRREAREVLAALYDQRLRHAERYRRAEPDVALAPKPDAGASLSGPALWARRLLELDEAGAYRAHLAEKAHLEVETEPPGAEVVIERAVEGGAAPWSPLLSPGTTPLRDLPLEPGSYRLVLRRPDRPAVYYPVLLARGERLHARVPLPRALPESFAYVPPGRFLYGSDDDESIRRTAVRVAPMHALETEGYLIGKHEVTYADYLAFLSSLAPAERQQRRPHARTYFGGIELVEWAPGRWELRLQREGYVSSAKEGEPLRYRDRSGPLAVQDWRQFPVSSISWLDAREYLRWLSRTGRVPGARLCDEREWERAARGADGRNYPHGNRLAPDDANFDLTYGQKTYAFGPDRVGSHPKSDSPFGVSDLAGNVREWMHLAGLPDQVAYGDGDFYQDVFTARSINHGAGEPQQRDPFIGLRVCAPAPAP